MKKLRFKNRNGILYFGFGDNLKSSKMKDTKFNRNIIVGKYQRGELDDDLSVSTNKSVTISELLDEVQSSKKHTVKPNSLLAFIYASKKHIIPKYGNTLVSNFKAIDLKKLQDNLINNGYSLSLIHRVRGNLSEVFELAIIKELVEVNPVKMVSPPRVNNASKSEKQKPFTLDEIDLILENADEELRNFLGILFFTGMRSGELLALTWDDIDFVTETISINKTVAAGAIGTPKTKSSDRDIEMLDSVKPFLKSQQLKTALKGSYIFYNKRSLYYATNMVFKKRYTKLLEELSLEYRNIHNTRHTFASLMLNNKIEPYWVSNMLGHESLDITLRVYSKYIPRKEKMSLPFLEKRYKNGTSNL